MPLFYMACPKCAATHKRILEPKMVEAQVCGKDGCDSVLIRTPSAPSSRVMETFDNGLMARKVERLRDIEEMLDEDAHKDWRHED